MYKSAITLLITVLWIVLTISAACAQFIHFSMKVEPELSTNIVQNLDFGTLTTGSGTRHIEKGSSGMGVFEIRALTNQHVLATLDSPEYLIHSNPGIDDRIPISLQASYNTNGDNSIKTARPFSDQMAWFRIGNAATSASDARTRWESAYIYIYGNMKIGNVREGLYTAVLVLNVEYL